MATDANEHVIRRYAYGSKNQLMSETKAEGEQDTQVYNALGQVSRYTYNANQ